MSDTAPITDLELAAMESRARLVGSANCWTGTGGSVAADSFRLIAEVRRLRAQRGVTSELLATLAQDYGSSTSQVKESP